MTSTIIFVLIISFIATLVRSTFGFGESLVAVPLFLLFLPLEIAVPLSVMLSIVIALIVVIQDYKQIHLNSAKWLILYALVGIPIGIALLIHGNEVLIKIGLGALIILYALYSIFAAKARVLEKDNMLWLFICGFLSGILGGAYGLNGPPLVIYGNLRRWSRGHFRATLQAYFLLASLIAAIGYYAKGLITSEVNIFFSASLITAIPAVFLGRHFNRQLRDDSFFKYVYWGLVGVGIILMVTTLQ